MKNTKLHDLLLIDDDRSLGNLLSEYCEGVGLSVSCAWTGEEGLDLASQHRFDLIILDVMLPGLDGFETLRRLRTISPAPVLMLSTRSAIMDRVRGLNDGADDYMSKPFEAEELVARVNSILRRVHREEDSSSITIGDLALDHRSRMVVKNGQRVELTGGQYELLRVLLETPGKAFPREELIPYIFGRSPYGSDRSIDNLINSLRRRLGPHSDGTDRFKSVRNIGYSYVLLREP